MWKHKSDALEIRANLIDKDAVNGKEALKLTIGVLYDNDRIPISFIDGEPPETPKKTPEVDYDKLVIIPEPPLSNLIPEPGTGAIKIGDVYPYPGPVVYEHKPDGFVNQYQTNAEECRVYGQTLTTKEVPRTYTTVAGEVPSGQIVKY